MKSPKHFNEKKWKDTLKEAHDFALNEKDKTKQEIENVIKVVDSVELLSQISFITNFVPEGKPESNQDLRDKPILHFLAGLCLKSGNHSNRLPDNQEIGRVVELLDKYFIYYSQDLIFQSAKKERVPDTDALILSARLQKMISTINPSMYQFQLEDLLKNVFGKFDDYFVREIGFTISNALLFGQKIIKRYERLQNKRVEEAREARERAKLELKDPIKGPQMQKILTQKKTTEKELLESYFGFLLFTLTQELFIFTTEEFCKEEEIKEIVTLEKYLKALSCRFGEVNSDFDSPLDENAITIKPIISIDGNKYFSPLIQDLIFNLPLIFERFLDAEKQRQTRIWQKYQRQKSRYTENKIYEYLSRLFPKQNILRNLHYTYQGQECEVDILIPYDNKIFIVESKSGSFTEPAKRGKIKRLETDLKKLIEEAHQQGRRVIDYIKSSETAIFKDKSNREVFEVRFRPNQIDFFVINVTFENLMSLAAVLKNLQSLGLFAENEYPWSVSLFELDHVTKHIPSPTIFIHYLERRLAAQGENIFYAFDELSFLAWYLEKGNFYTPVTKDSKKFNLVLLDGSMVADFDDHYLYGKDAPKLKIEPGLLKIIRILEKLHPVGYSNVASTLLDFDHQAREFILKNINELIEKTKTDRKAHDFTVLYKDVVDTGFTFMTQCGRERLTAKLGTYCAVKKYQTKTKRWIGIGSDVLDNEWFVNEFAYFDFPWISDAVMDEVIKEYPFIKGEANIPPN